MTDEQTPKPNTAQFDEYTSNWLGWYGKNVDFQKRFSEGFREVQFSRGGHWTYKEDDKVGNFQFRISALCAFYHPDGRVVVWTDWKCRPVDAEYSGHCGHQEKEFPNREEFAKYIAAWDVHFDPPEIPRVPQKLENILKNWKKPESDNPSGAAA